MAVTRDDVAKHAGVSSATVSRVLTNSSPVSDAVREKVFQSVKELKYIPNEAARLVRFSGRESAKKTLNLSCVLFYKEHTKYSHPGANRLIEEIERQALKHKYHIFSTYTAFQLDYDINLFNKAVNPANIDCVITMGNPEHPVEREVLRRIGGIIKPVVCISSRDVDGFDNIGTDHFQGARKAVSYLAGLGHKRIGIMMNKKHLMFTGYCQALKENALEYDETIVAGYEETEDDVPVVEKGYAYMNKLLDKAHPLPTAVFVSNAPMAIGAMDAIKARGLKIPDDISILADDDSAAAASCSPALTCIKVVKDELGRLAVERAMERMKDPGLKPVNILIPFELVERESCRII